MRRRSIKALIASAGITAFLIAPGAAYAVQAWEYPDANGHNTRRSSDAPPRTIGSPSTNPSKPTSSPKLPVWQRTFDSEVTGTPIAAINGGVYVGDRSGVLHVLIYSNGRTYCSQNVGAIGTGTAPTPITGSPLYVHAKNTVYVVVNKPGRPRLVAVDALTCDPKWSTVIDDTINWEASDPTYHPTTNLIYVGTCVCSAEENHLSGVGGRGYVLAINPDTGEIVWKTPTVSSAFNGGGVAGTPLLSDSGDRVIVGTDHAFAGGEADPNTDAVVALDGLTGQIVDSFQAHPNDIESVSSLDPSTKLGFAASPIRFTSNGTQLIGAADKSGVFYALDPSTMELVWKVDVVPGDTQIGRVLGLAYDPSTHNIHGTTATPPTFFGIDGDGGTLLYAQPGPAPMGLPSFASNAVWAADAAGFLDLQDAVTGRLIGRLPLKVPSTGGVSFTRRYAFVAIGTGEGTGGGVAAFK